MKSKEMKKLDEYIEREEEEERTHGDKVADLKSFLRDHNIPPLPLTVCESETYRADIIFRFNHKFVVCDYINTEPRINWDVGGLALLTMHRDILKYAVAIIDDDLWNKHREFFERVKTYRNTKFPKLKLMNPKTFKEWVKTKHKEMEEITSNF